MKTILTTLLILISIAGFSQKTKMTKEQAKKKVLEMMGKQGTLAFEIDGDGNKTSVSVSLIYANGKYVIGPMMNKMRTDKEPGYPDKPIVLISIDDIKEGVHEFSKTYKNASGITINGKVYEIRGSCKIKQLNGKIYGSFQGELIDIVKRDGAKKKEDRIDEKAKAGNISGTFSNLTLINIGK
jgi:hypothetical protein